MKRAGKPAAALLAGGLSRHGFHCTCRFCVEASEDERIEALLASAIADEDADTVDLCETALKTIIQPGLRESARASCAEIIAARKVRP